MGCCKRPPKMPSKTGVSRAEIVAHAFECSLGSKDGCEAVQGPRRKCDKKLAAAATPCVCTDAFTSPLRRGTSEAKMKPGGATPGFSA